MMNITVVSRGCMSFGFQVDVKRLLICVLIDAVKTAIWKTAP